MIQCPECRSLIPDDSVFCDQCGKELHWCPECGRPKRGTVCPVCGSELGPRPSSVAEEIPPRASLGRDDKEKSSALAGSGLRLTLQPGPFGRRGGIWPELASCPYVSGNHGTIAKTDSGWTITDAGSTNGTFINGARLTPGSAAPLKKGDRVRIATLDFTVE